VVGEVDGPSPADDGSMQDYGSEVIGEKKRKLETQAEVAKISRMQSIDPQDLPTTYSSNSEEEKLVLEYVENFRRQFVQLYPERKELLLCPRNECGVEKFICTTIRPTKLEYNELYDLKACAMFVAEHIHGRSGTASTRASCSRRCSLGWGSTPTL
jgi:hypothetical protein